ncbi:MAG: zinc metalloprotease HtpX [Candidatus Sulfotelmatobacter sp.]
MKGSLPRDYNVTVMATFGYGDPSLRLKTAALRMTTLKVRGNEKDKLMGNTFKTAFLLTALTLLLMLIGRAFGGENGMFIALAIAVVMNFVSYFFSDKIALAMYRAQPVTREELPRAYDIVERLTQKIGIPMPKIYVIPTESPNAFATGRNPNHASVAVTHGILGLLNDEEMEGVLAHELGHVRNRDILISSVAATIAGAITMLASMGRWAMIFGGWGGDREERGGGGGIAALIMLILAPIAATLIQLAVSRSREYQADASGAKFTGNPYALASALQKLDAYSRRVPMQATPSTAHLFIIQPLLGISFGNLFSTHPPIAKRIERLTGRPAEFMQ